MLRSSYRRKVHRYLRTPVWAERSRRFRLQSNFRCAGCGLVSARNHAHHLSYARAFKGKEPDSDLLCLCPPCHRAAHAYARAHPALSLRAATFRALRTASPRPGSARTDTVQPRPGTRASATRKPLRLR